MTTPPRVSPMEQYGFRPCPVLNDAQSHVRHTAIGPTVIPHLNDPIIAVAARAGLLAVAGQHLQWVVGETVTLACTTQVNAVFAGQWRAHAVQAINVLAGAAATRVRIATPQEASITIEGGNITFECPGTITYRAAVRNLSGAQKMNYHLPIFPGNVCIECLIKRAQTRGPFVNKGSGPI